MTSTGASRHEVKGNDMTDFAGDALRVLNPLSGSATAVIADGVSALDPSALTGGGVIVKIETSGDGRAGLTDDGRLIYRPAEDFTGSERIVLTVRQPDGSTREVATELSVRPDVVAGGWGEGEHYVLARDADGWHVTEAGLNHRTVHVSPDGRDDGFGATPETAISPARLDALMGEEVYLNGVNTRGGTVPASWHVLFERGQDYGTYTPPVVSGEDPLHPFVVGAWGEGDRPTFGQDLRIWGTFENVVVRDLEFAPSEAGFAAAEDAGAVYRLRGIDVLGADHVNLLFENVVVRPYNSEVRLQSESENVTLYRVGIHDAHRENPEVGNDWTASASNRVQGVYISRIDGVLIEDSFAHHNGWEEGYRPDGGRDAQQPPSKYSHNFYFHESVTDVTFRDTITASAASTGAQLRPGAFVDGNLFFDNNVGFNSGSAPQTDDGWGGQKILILDTVVTDPSNKDALKIGARGWGVLVEGQGLVADLIVAQDGDGLDTRPAGVGNAFKNDLRLSVEPFVEGVTVFNWGMFANDAPHADVSSPALMDVTLRAFIKQQLGATLGVDDLVVLWRDRDRDNWDDFPTAQDVVDFFRDGFGYDANDATAFRRVTFEGDLRGDGFRWDNRLNWSDDLAPVAGDAIDLDGHAATFAPETIQVRSLDFGQGGSLKVVQGQLTVTGAAGVVVDRVAGRIDVSQAGQFLFNGYNDVDRLEISMTGGRVANTGTVSGAIDVDLFDGQLLFGDSAGAFRLTTGSELSIIGDAGQVGFDGPSGTASFMLNGGALRFAFDSDGVSAIEEFRSGRFGTQAPGVRSEAYLYAGELVVDVSSLASPLAKGRHVLMDVDRIVGGLDRLTTRIEGLADGVVATLDLDRTTGELALVFGGPPLDGGVVAPDPDVETPDPVEDAPIVVEAPERGEGVVINETGDSFVFNGVRSALSLDLTVAGGVAGNVGFVDGRLNAVVTAGEFALASGAVPMLLHDGSRLTIEGDAATVGFDQTGGRGVMQLRGGELRFVFDADGVSTIREYDGALGGAAIETLSMVRLLSGDLVVDLSGLDPAAGAARHMLIDVDTLPDGLGAVNFRVIGVADDRQAAFGVDAEAGDLWIDIL